MNIEIGKTYISRSHNGVGPENVLVTSIYDSVVDGLSKYKEWVTYVKYKKDTSDEVFKLSRGTFIDCYIDIETYREETIDNILP